MLALAAVLAPALRPDRTYAFRDAASYYAPLFEWCSSEWRAGRIPLWNPLENCGTPAHADPTTSLWYPGKLIFALPLPFAGQYKLYVAGHLALCAASSAWLARRWQASPAAAALAALSYALGGSVLSQHANVVYLVGAAWLPFAAGQLDTLVSEATARSMLLLGVILALVVLGGDPQLAYHILLMGAVYLVIIVRWRSARVTAPAVAKVASGAAGELRVGGSSLLVCGGYLAGAALLAAALAAIQILPAAEAATASERARYVHPRNLYESLATLLGHRGTAAAAGAAATERDSPPRADVAQGIFGPPAAGTHHAAVYEFSVAPWRFAELVWPNGGGRMFPTHRRWFSLLPEESRIWAPSLYLGLVPLVLGFSTLVWRRTDPRTCWLSWLVLLFTLGSLGTFGLGWLARHAASAFGASGENFPLGDGVGGVYWLLVTGLPRYVEFRYPAKLLVVGSLAIAQLAAIGWDRATLAPPRRLIAGLYGLALVSAVGTLVTLVLSLWWPLGSGATDRVFGPFDSAGAWRDIVGALAHTAVVAALSAWLLARLSVPNLKHVRWAQGGLLVLTAVELVVANAWLVPTAPAALWREKPAATEAISADSSPARIFRGPLDWPARFREQCSSERMAEIARWQRDTLAPRYALGTGHGLVNSYDGLKAADYERQLAAQTADGRAWIVTHGACQYELAAANPALEPILEPVNDSFPRVQFVSRLENAERTPDAGVANKATLRISSESPQQVTILATLAEPGWLVLRDRDWPGWRATVTSGNASGPPRVVPIERADRLFRAVALPAGEHTVEFRYAPRRFLAGAAISGASWLLLLAAASGLLLRARRHHGRI
jgi:hypothetical protein